MSTHKWAVEPFLGVSQGGLASSRSWLLLERVVWDAFPQGLLPN